MVVFCARFTIILTLHPINFINPINRVKQQRPAEWQAAACYDEWGIISSLRQLCGGCR